MGGTVDRFGSTSSFSTSQPTMAPDKMTRPFFPLCSRAPRGCLRIGSEQISPDEVQHDFLVFDTWPMQVKMKIKLL